MATTVYSTNIQHLSSVIESLPLINPPLFGLISDKLSLTSDSVVICGVHLHNSHGLYITYRCVCDQICQKGVLYMQSFKTHFSSPFVSYIIGPRAHVFNTAEGRTVCFHSDLILKPTYLKSTNAWVTFKWPHLPLASRQPSVIHHTTG